MRNLRELIIVLISLFYFSQTNAQCPPPVFQVSDTVCPGQNLVINNASSTAVKFNWDFCPGDLDSLPVLTAAASPGSVSYPQNMKIVEENGNYYGFIANAGFNYVTRYDFGNSPANAPVAFTLASDPLLAQFQSGIDVVKEGNKWIIFVTMFSSNQLLRLELDSLTHLTPVISNLGISGLWNPTSIKLIDGYAFITNNQATTIVRLDFGGSYLNTPIELSPAINTLAFNNFGIDISYDCSTGNYTGFNTGFGVLNKIEFGNSLSNSPTVTAVSTGIGGALGINLVQEKGNWHLFMVSSSNVFSHYKLGNSISNTPILDYSSAFGGVLADPKSIQMIKTGSAWMGISSNSGLFSFVRHVFPQGCTGGPSSSTLQSPSGISYAQSNNGYQTFELTETFSNGSTARYLDSVYVTILPPLAGFTAGPGCKNTPTQFTDNSTVCFGTLSNWNWDFGDGNSSNVQNPAHTYSTSGIFQVTLTVTGSTGLTDTFSQTIQINDAPDAWFSIPLTACAGSDVSILDSSTANSGTLSTWTWTLGDSSSASLPVFNHAYQAPGTYNITMTVTTDVGCSDSITRNITILPGPFAGFSIANTCIGETVAFTNTSVSPGTTIQSYSWDFGDGNTNNTSNPQHAYASTTGQYNVQLICVAVNGCTDTLYQTVKIGNKPQPGFTASDDTACSFSVVQFTDLSTPATGDTIIRRIWDFGDGTIDSVSTSPTHSYSLPGLYTVRLTTISPVDCDSTYSYNIFIIESPTANFTINNACLGNPHNFNDLSTAPTGSTINYWDWDFGNSATSNQPSVVYTYPDTGNYTVTLIVRSNIGCYDTLALSATVNKLPVANFTFSKICSDQPVTFTDSSTVDGSIINSWNWNFGTFGGNSTQMNPTATFPDALAYPVTLIVTTVSGCQDTIIKMAVVSQSPKFIISTPDHCSGNSQLMSATITSGNTGNLSYLWNFGDSTASFLANPSHTYSASGQYTATLTVTNLSNGCEVMKTDTLTVYDLPLASFVSSGQCEGELTQFTDSSQVSSGSIVSWEWQLGSSGSSTLPNPSVIFSTDGNQLITLRVTSTAGCKDSVNKSITIYPRPRVSFTNTPEYGAPPLLITYTNVSDSGTHVWNFGDGSPLYTGNNPQHIYSDTGAFITTLTTTSPYGCTNQYSSTNYVLIPRRDLAINGLSYTKVNDQWVMKAIVANYGNEDAYTFELKAQLNNEAVFYNTFDADTLKAGSFREYTFNTKLDALNEGSPAFFCAEVVSVNLQLDMNTANNRFCISSSSGFSIINAYPNPTNGILFLGIQSETKSDVLISLFESDGRLIREEKSYRIEEGLNTLSLDISELQGGHYILKIIYGDTEKSLRFIRR